MGVRGTLATVYVLAMVARAAAAAAMVRPGTFDSAYYLHVAQNLAVGRGLVEDVVWNYLDTSPVALALPRPSHLYWMPLSSLLAWVGLSAFGAALDTHRAAAVPLVLLAGFVPTGAAWLAWSWSRRLDVALAAGLLGIASGYHAVYAVSIDTFTPFTLAVALCLVGAWQGLRGRWVGWAAAGLGVGLAQLTRADGFLLAIVVAVGVVRTAWRARSLATFLRAALLSGGVALVLVSPWLARNLVVAGSMVPGNGSAAVWLRTYDELFAYGVGLSPGHLLSSGPGALLAERLRAGIAAFMVLLGGTWIALLPVVVAGWWTLRRAVLAQLFALYAVLLTATLVLLFPAPTQWGTYLHSSSVFLPWSAALASVGISRLARALSRGRPAHQDLLRQALLSLAVVWALGTTAIVVRSSLFGPAAPGDLYAPWNERYAHYSRVGEVLQARGAEGPILVIDPPGFTVTTRRPSLMVPSNGLDAVNAVADRFGAQWLLAERHRLADWSPGRPPAGWGLEAQGLDATASAWRLFRRTEQP